MRFDIILKSHCPEPVVFKMSKDCSYCFCYYSEVKENAPKNVYFSKQQKILCPAKDIS